MASLYDRLQDQLGDEDEQSTAGLSPLDLADLPDPQRKVMFFLLRGARAKASDVAREQMAQALDDVDDLDGALDALTKRGWLIAFGEPPDVRYRINFRQRRGSQLSVNLWSTLIEHLDDISPSER